MPLTRARLRTLRSAIIMDENLLVLILDFTTIRDLTEVAAVCKAWHECSLEVFRAWRRAPSLYLVGGCDGGAHPASAQARQTTLRYDEKGDDWIKCAALHKARDHHALVSCDGSLYALGGWSGSRNRVLRRGSIPRLLTLSFTVVPLSSSQAPRASATHPRKTSGRSCRGSGCGRRVRATARQ